MKSIMQSKKECYLCRRTDNLHEHHIFEGTGRRRLSEKYGLKVYLCAQHHNMSDESVHFNADLRNELYQDGQRAFERVYPGLNFLEIFSINFL